MPPGIRDQCTLFETSERQEPLIDSEPCAVTHGGRDLDGIIGRQQRRHPRPYVSGRGVREIGFDDLAQRRVDAGLRAGPASRLDDPNRARRSNGLGGEAGLALTGWADDERKRGRAAIRPVERVAKDAELRLSAHEPNLLRAFAGPKSVKRQASRSPMPLRLRLPTGSNSATPFVASRQVGPTDDLARLGMLLEPRRNVVDEGLASLDADPDGEPGGGRRR
jgi:hypothetical protein